ncbi:hypothetical protein J7L13_01735 [bacterium]|nr:hypothetical protein [bacterium]
MKRRKFFLSTLAVFLSLVLVGLWGLFFAGKFSLIADFLLPPAEKKEVLQWGEELLKGSLYRNLEVENKKVSLARSHTEPEWETLTNLQFKEVRIFTPEGILRGASSLSADERQTLFDNTVRRFICVFAPNLPICRSKEEGESLGKTAGFVYGEVVNPTDQYFSPVYLKVPLALKEREQRIVWGRTPLYLGEDGYYLYLTEKLAPHQTLKFVVGIAGEEKTENILAWTKEWQLVGKQWSFSLAEEEKVLDYSSASLKVVDQRIYPLARFPLATAEFKEWKEQFQSPPQKSVYLNEVVFWIENQGERVWQGRVGFKIDREDVLLFSGEFSDGYWFIETPEIPPGAKVSVAGWVLTKDKALTTQEVEEGEVKVYADRPSYTFQLSSSYLTPLSFSPIKCVPGPSCENSENGFGIPYCSGVIPEGDTARYLFVNWIFDGPREGKGALYQYQQVFFSPPLRAENNEKTLLIGGGLYELNADSDSPLERASAVQPFWPLKPAIGWQHLVGRNPGEEAENAPRAFGLRFYKGLLWKELELPSEEGGEISLGFSAEPEEVAIQVRSYVNGEYTSWVNIGPEAESVQIAPGTEKVQIRVFFFASDPEGINIQSLSFWPKGTTGFQEQPLPSQPSPTQQVSQRLISTGTHFLLLLVISVILIISIVYIVALLREEQS